MMKTESSWSSRARCAQIALVTLVLLTATVPVFLAEENGDAEISDVLRADLEGVLKARIADLLKDKTEDGVSYKRGAYSKSFKKVDDSTYQVTFHQDTANENHLKTERFLLTLKKGGGKWAVEGEELQETYQALYRGIPGDEHFYRFEKMSFDNEGLKFTATNGSFYKDFLEGKTSRFKIVASDLDFEYAPPEGLDYYQLHKQVMLKQYPDVFVFNPKSVRIECVAPSCDMLESSIFTGLSKISLEEIDPWLRKDYQEALKEAKESIRENPFRFFRRLPKEDRRVYTIFIDKAGGREHWVALDNDNYEPKEVTFFARGHGSIFSYNSKEVRESGVPPYELERRDDLSAREYDVVSVEGTVELALEDSESLVGDITYVVNIKKDLNELPIRISRLRNPGQDTQDARNPRLFLNSIQNGEGQELTWVKTGPFSGLLVFPEQVAAGTQLTLRINFTSFDSIIKLNPSYSYLDRGGWLPLVRFPDRIQEINLTVKVPDKFTTLGIGKKTSESRKNGILTTTWESESPGALPTVIFGDYISDKPSFKATKIDGTEIPVTVYVDKVSTHSLDSFEAATSGAMSIRGKQLKSLGEQAANALNLFREVYGVDYPYAKLDLVNAPFFPGAQAPPSIIYLGSFLFRGEGALAMQTGGSSTNIAKFLKDTVAHEVGHQWWAHLVSTANQRNYWFVESLAEYSSALYVENVYSRKKYLEKVEAWRENILSVEMLTSVQDAPVLWGGEQPGAAYIANVYNKGPYAFHILRQTFGDEKFFAFMKMLVNELQNKEIVTRDIQVVAEKSFGGSMEWFFDQWLRGVGLPEYSFNYSTRRTEDGSWLVQGNVKQRIVAGKEKNVLDGVYYRGVVPITVTFRKGKDELRKRIMVEGAESKFAFKLPKEPLEIAFNKYGEILAHDVKVNETW